MDSSSSAGEVIGNFLMIATSSGSSIVLGDNNAYKPTHHHYKEMAKTWVKGNRIRLIKGKGKNYTLINLSRAQTIKTKRIKIAN